MNTLPHTYVERNRNHPLAFIAVVVALKGEQPVCVCVCGCVFLPPRFFVLPGKSSIFRTLIVPKEKKRIPHHTNGIKRDPFATKPLPTQECQKSGNLINCHTVFRRLVAVSET